MNTTMKNLILFLSSLLASAAVWMCMAIILSLLLSAEASADCFTNIRYGNCFGNDRNSVKIYSPDGKYMGNLNDNEFDPNSVSNQFGRYGNPYSWESINNPYGRYSVQW